jgi:hypothetical protein
MATCKERSPLARGNGWGDARIRDPAQDLRRWNQNPGSMNIDNASHDLDEPSNQKPILRTNGLRARLTTTKTTRSPAPLSSSKKGLHLEW